MCVSDIHFDFARALHQAHCITLPYMFKLFRIELGMLEIKAPGLWRTEPGSQVEMLIDHTFSGSAWKQCETQTDQ